MKGYEQAADDDWEGKDAEDEESTEDDSEEE
jgi:hypothetical protein